MRIENHLLHVLEDDDAHSVATRHAPVSVQVPPSGQYRIHRPLVSG
jgi:hypothetical protein